MNQKWLEVDWSIPRCGGQPGAEIPIGKQQAQLSATPDSKFFQDIAIMGFDSSTGNAKQAGYG
jgi:hypothetical protein